VTLLHSLKKVKETKIYQHLLHNTRDFKLNSVPCE